MDIRAILKENTTHSPIPWFSNHSSPDHEDKYMTEEHKEDLRKTSEWLIVQNSLILGTCWCFLGCVDLSISPHQHDHTDVGGEEANHHGKLDLWNNLYWTGLSNLTRLNHNSLNHHLDEYELPGCVDMGSQLQPISLLQRAISEIYKIDEWRWKQKRETQVLVI